MLELVAGGAEGEDAQQVVGDVVVEVVLTVEDVDSLMVLLQQPRRRAARVGRDACQTREHARRARVDVQLGRRCHVSRCEMNSRTYSIVLT